MENTQNPGQNDNELNQEELKNVNGGTTFILVGLIRKEEGAQPQPGQGNNFMGWEDEGRP
jgi:bacteriocin-like protein